MRKIDRRIVIVAAFVFIVALAYGVMRFLIAQKEEPPVHVPVDENDLFRLILFTIKTFFRQYLREEGFRRYITS